MQKTPARRVSTASSAVASNGGTPSKAPPASRQTAAAAAGSDKDRRPASASAASTTNGGGALPLGASCATLSSSCFPSAGTTMNGGGGDHIKVYVRLRDYNAAEKQRWIPNDMAVRMRDQTCEVTVPGRGHFPFTFDDCFWSNSHEEDGKAYTGQEDMFEAVGRPLVDNVMAGFNSSIIAYGQTGSGKTYSIFGPSGPDGSSGEDRGLIPRVCDNIFARLGSEGSSSSLHTVSVSMLEVYLEDVFDLLNGRKKLAIRQESTTSFGVVGAKTYEVRSYNEVVHLIQKGDSLKTFAATAMNERSSRAHTLFQLTVNVVTASGSRTAKVMLADLAGCERIKQAKTDHGTALDEACNINLSLLTLGTCIEAAVQRSKQGRTVENMGEFRQSSLTKLLKDFIGGNSRTAMLIAIAPTLKDVNLTLQALRFADRAKQIQTHAKINYVAQANPNVEGEAVRAMFDRRRELLEKECELEMAATSLRSKELECERARAALEEERAVVQARMQLALTSDEERKMLHARIKEIEEQARSLQSRFDEARRRKEELEANLLEVCQDNDAIVSDREVLERRVHELQCKLRDTEEEKAEETIAGEAERHALEERIATLCALHAQELEGQRAQHAVIANDLRRSLKAEQEQRAAAEERAEKRQQDLQAKAEEASALAGQVEGLQRAMAASLDAHDRIIQRKDAAIAEKTRDLAAATSLAHHIAARLEASCDYITATTATKADALVQDAGVSTVQALAQALDRLEQTHATETRRVAEAHQLAQAKAAVMYEALRVQSAAMLDAGLEWFRHASDAAVDTMGGKQEYFGGGANIVATAVAEQLVAERSAHATAVAGDLKAHETEREAWGQEKARLNDATRAVREQYAALSDKNTATVQLLQTAEDRVQTLEAQLARTAADATAAAIASDEKMAAGERRRAAEIAQQHQQRDAVLRQAQEMVARCSELQQSFLQAIDHNHHPTPSSAAPLGGNSLNGTCSSGPRDYSSCSPKRDSSLRLAALNVNTNAL